MIEKEDLAFLRTWAYSRHGARAGAKLPERARCQNRRYFRPAEVDVLLGDASKAERVLGWRHKTTFDELVSEMVASDLETVIQERKRILHEM